MCKVQVDSWFPRGGIFSATFPLASVSFLTTHLEVKCNIKWPRSTLPTTHVHLWRYPQPYLHSTYRKRKGEVKRAKRIQEPVESSQASISNSRSWSDSIIKSEDRDREKQTFGVHISKLLGCETLARGSYEQIKRIMFHYGTFSWRSPYKLGTPCQYRGWYSSPGTTVLKHMKCSGK